jgi:hypothetical protein
LPQRFRKEKGSFGDEGGGGKRAYLAEGVPLLIGVEVAERLDVGVAGEQSPRRLGSLEATVFGEPFLWGGGRG